MTANRISDLLPIDEGNDSPHAYEVFGLEPGESNADLIRQTVDEVIARVKAAKTNTDPATWKTVAGLVQKARVTLANPEAKSKLDAQFGIVGQGTRTPSNAVDPLASVLPAADPLAAVLPAANQTSPVAPVTASHLANDAQSNPLGAQPSAAASSMPPGLFQTPVASPTDVVNPASHQQFAGNHTQTAATSMPIPAPAPRRSPRRVARRKKSMVGPVMMGGVVVGLLGLTGMLGYFLFAKGGTGAVAITRGGGEIKISTGNPSTADTDSASQPNPSLEESVVSKPRQVDSIIGNTPGTARAERVSQTPVDTSIINKPFDSNTPMPGNKPSDSGPAMTDASSELSRIRKAIKTADWASMKQIAEKAATSGMSGEVEREISGICEVIDLASYYRGAIVRGMEKLQATNTLELTGLQIVVVSKTSDALTVMYNKKTRTFAIDEFPSSLSSELASQSITDAPTFEAAKAIYEAILPTSNEAKRMASIDALTQVTGDVAGVDPKKAASALRKIYAP